jgi:hypothetical protein
LIRFDATWHCIHANHGGGVAELFARRAQATVLMHIVFPAIIARVARDNRHQTFWPSRRRHQ